MNQKFVLTAHVLDSYRRFYPNAERTDVHEAVLESTLVDTDAIRVVLGRVSNDAKFASAYYLHSERSGVFVFAESERDPDVAAVVTFLRFYSYDQYQHAVSLFGAPIRFSADCNYASSVAAQLSTNIWGDRTIIVAPKVQERLTALDREVHTLRWRALDEHDRAAAPRLRQAEFTTMLDVMKLYAHRTDTKAWVYVDDTDLDANNRKAHPFAYRKAVVSKRTLFALHDLGQKQKSRGWAAYSSISPDEWEPWVRETILATKPTEVRPGVLRFTFEGVDLWAIQAHRSNWFLSVEDYDLTQEQRCAIELLHGTGTVRWAP